MAVSKRRTFSSISRADRIMVVHKFETIAMAEGARMSSLAWYYSSALYRRQLGVRRALANYIMGMPN